MTPRLTITYLALTRSGMVVYSADRPSLVHAFIARQAGKGVNLVPAVKRETITPLVAQADAREKGWSHA